MAEDQEPKVLYTPSYRISIAKSHGHTTQEGYEAVLAEIATTRLKKVLSYGEDRYNVDGHEQEVLMYGDIQRKFGRIRQLMLNLDPELNGRMPVATDGEALRETLADLANYCIMGMQLIDAGKLQLDPTPFPTEPPKPKVEPATEEELWGAPPEPSYGQSELAGIIGDVAATNEIFDPVSETRKLDGMVLGTTSDGTMDYTNINYMG